MTSKEKKRITLRLPKEVNKNIQLRAKEVGVSVNAYILMMLVKELSKEK